MEVVLPLAIALGLAGLAGLNLAGNRVGRRLSWIVQPLVLAGGGLVTAQQVFTVPLLETAFRQSGDAALARLDVRALVDAAVGAFPAWFPYLVTARFALATLGSLLVMLLLAAPSASAYFRGDGPSRRDGQRARGPQGRGPASGRPAPRGG